MLDTLKIFLVLFILVLLIDIPVISLLFKSRWEKTIKNIQGSNLNIKPIYAFITYILIPIGLLLFVYPKIDNKNWLQTSLIYGFLFGFISYGIFDFTNLALIDKYPLDLAIIDSVWGGILCAIVVTITKYIFK
jgi:uncharacterized membrane protein